jgi:redox-sensitive bicupin YhaK (pirin superfamily)
MPAGRPGIRRTLYFFNGAQLTVENQRVPVSSLVKIRPDAEITIQNGSEGGELLLLQGRPIGEPVVQYGPFVMNSRAEIQQAFVDYQRTGFGGWPWRADDPVLPRQEGRYARHADGRVERVG